jgi:hypothetical protein
VHLRPSSSQKAMTSTGARSSGGAPDSCSTCQMHVRPQVELRAPQYLKGSRTALQLDPTAMLCLLRFESTDEGCSVML